jgi:hypothetical protein
VQFSNVRRDCLWNERVGVLLDYDAWNGLLRWESVCFLSSYIASNCVPFHAPTPQNQRCTKTPNQLIPF